MSKNIGLLYQCTSLDEMVNWYYSELTNTTVINSATYFIRWEPQFLLTVLNSETNKPSIHDLSLIESILNHPWYMSDPGLKEIIIGILNYYRTRKV